MGVKSGFRTQKKCSNPLNRGVSSKEVMDTKILLYIFLGPKFVFPEWGVNNIIIKIYRNDQVSKPVSIILVWVSDNLCYGLQLVTSTFSTENLVLNQTVSLSRYFSFFSLPFCMKMYQSCEEKVPFGQFGKWKDWNFKYSFEEALKIFFFSISVMLEVQKLQLVRSYYYIIVNICVNKEPFSYYSNTVNPLSLNKVLSCTIYYCNYCLENNFLLHLIC